MKEYLVTGFPRSGTTFTSDLMQAAGYDVRHEKMGADGISSYAWVNPEKRTLALSEFRHRIHVVRDPLKAVSSACFRFQSMRFIDMFSPVVTGFRENAQIYNVVLAYLVWTREADLIADTRIQVEHIDKELFGGVFAGKIANTNKSDHDDLSVDDLYAVLEKDLVLRFLEVRSKFGYGE